MLWYCHVYTIVTTVVQIVGDKVCTQMPRPTMPGGVSPWNLGVAIVCIFDG